MRDPSMGWIVLAVQFAGCIAIVGGLAYMVGLRAVGARLAACGFIGMIVALAVVPYRIAVGEAIGAIPVWVRTALIIVVSVIVGLQILRALIALFFGRRIADNVTSDLLSWTIKGAINAIALPRRLITLVARLFAQDAVP
jgi:hypothetical protein